MKNYVCSFATFVLVTSSVLTPTARASALIADNQNPQPLDGQANSPTPTAESSFLSGPLPAAISAYGEFNQLGTPHFNLGLSAIYSTGNNGVFMTTSLDIVPKRALDTSANRNFYSVSASVRQGIGKDLFNSGRFRFLLGADVGPNFSNSQASSAAANFSGSVNLTTVYQINQHVRLVAPIRALYISGAGWNPILAFGIAIKLPQKGGVAAGATPHSQLK